MNEKKTSLAVAALRGGTVIDHIPSEALFRVAHILGIENMSNAVTIGYNLPSARGARKGIIKVDGVEFDHQTLNRIAVIAPTATVNIIRDYEVVSKHPVELPDTLIGIVKCPNPKCITNNEPMATRFDVSEHDKPTLRCHYCNHTVAGADAEII
ncbi:MAG: aspartate carbamoyltransferase regulatory subunit [Muribaculaceae bacterium]|nr:aspartate carbamoyltransferase regulatory subunit [Muribaculaceae bacterium]